MSLISVKTTETSPATNVNEAKAPQRKVRKVKKHFIVYLAEHRGGFKNVEKNPLESTS